ncbi:hypothetical protein BXU08_18425 [Sphingomonas sp. LM7]|nr:hypothetical protein BXU08_18425 [Sphingomonas sp. LM7]
MPRFREGQWGEWSLRMLPATAARGYWGRGYRTTGAVMLMGPFAGNAAAWMSIVPMEIESQEIGIAAAHGHTVVLGLGMGWCAANVACNPAVERVTVVERDADVIALVAALGVFDQLPAVARAKIEVVRDDALRWRPGERVDSLQADIWARFVTPRKWDDLRRMQDNIGAATIYFWGQELELWRLACRAQGRVPPAFDGAELSALVASTGLPLIIDGRPDYALRIAEAARWWTPQEDGWWNAE